MIATITVTAAHRGTAIRRGVGVERYDLRHGEDGEVVAYSLGLVAA